MLIDGLAVDSCIVPVAHAEGRKVITIEGAAKTRTGKALQNAFVEHGGAQCGICTPGMILAAAPLKRGATLQDIKTARRESVRCWLSEHLSFGRCRAQSQPASPKRERRREGETCRHALGLILERPRSLTAALSLLASDTAH